MEDTSAKRSREARVERVRAAVHVRPRRRDVDVDRAARRGAVPALCLLPFGEALAEAPALADHLKGILSHAQRVTERTSAHGLARFRKHLISKASSIGECLRKWLTQ